MEQFTAEHINNLPRHNDVHPNQYPSLLMIPIDPEKEGLQHEQDGKTYYYLRIVGCDKEGNPVAKIASPHAIEFNFHAAADQVRLKSHIFITGAIQYWCKGHLFSWNLTSNESMDFDIIPQ